MTLTNIKKAPFPYFGGKRAAAPIVWEVLGDVVHYIEPFAGSLAVLLERPHPCNRTYYSESVNDADGLLVNAWRSIQLRPDETAEHASNPVAEADLTARHLALVRWREERELERLMADPEFCDPKMAGWWMWGLSCSIGRGWCSGTGPWRADPVTGRLVKQGAGAREPGVGRHLPHLSDDGQGVNRPQAREPGVGDFHPVTMPEVRRWFAWLSARLRHVRILNGDWRRAVTGGASKTIGVRQGKGQVGIFLDPPYGDVRADGLYAKDDLTVAGAVRQWCIENGDECQLRIVLAGFDTEHAELVEHGWREVEWFKSGFLTGGMGHQQERERLWMSPHCLTNDRPAQRELFG